MLALARALTPFIDFERAHTPFIDFEHVKYLPSICVTKFHAIQHLSWTDTLKTSMDPARGRLPR